MPLSVPESVLGVSDAAGGASFAAHEDKTMELATARTATPPSRLAMVDAVFENGINHRQTTWRRRSSGGRKLHRLVLVRSKRGTTSSVGNTEHALRHAQRHRLIRPGCSGDRLDRRLPDREPLGHRQLR